MATAAFADGLIDTDVLIDAERGRADAIAFLAAFPSGSGVRISVVSAMELVVGCRNSTELGHVRQFLSRIMVLPIEVSTSKLAYSLVETYYLGHGMLIPDALIAATALERGFRSTPRTSATSG